MKAPPLPRWLAPVLVVLFALTTAWAGYAVVQEASAHPTGPSVPGIAYGGSGSYYYNASLAPNTLFNTTNVSGTNVTLFVAITHWINVTFTSGVALSSHAAINLFDEFTVTVSTDAWSKTLLTTVQNTSSPSGLGAQMVDRYAINVSAIETLAHTIDSELNYSALSFTVSLQASVSGTVVASASEGTVALAPSLNLTFQGALIVPKGAPATVTGTVGGGAGDPSGGGVGALALGGLVASIAALGASGWLLWVDRRSATAGKLPALARLIEPYEEVIAQTTRVPADDARLVPVERWEDLVKVADTLGRPILRPTGAAGAPEGLDFYVFDGTVSYRFHYPENGGTAPRDATGSRARTPPSLATAAAWPSGIVPAPPIRRAPAAGPPASVPKPTAAPAPTTARTTPASPAAGGRPPALPAPLPKGLARRLEFQLQRVRETNLEGAQRWYAFSLCSQAIRSVSAAGPEEAARIVSELERSLDRVLPSTGRAG